MATNTNVKKVQFEFHGSDGSSRRVIAAPALRAAPAFETFNAADGRWHQDALQHVPPLLLMQIGLRLAGEGPPVGIAVEGDTMTIVVGALDQVIQRGDMTNANHGHSRDRCARQDRIYAWAQQAFTVEQATSLPQRGLRLLEEAIEAFQAVKGDQQQAHQLVDYVFSRPAGVLHQELGGVSVTLLALAAAAGLCADEAEAREVTRVLAKPLEEFTRRNEAKNEAGFLAAPVADPASVLTSRERQTMEDLARGMTNREIAEHLEISIKTVSTHRGHVLKKLGLRNNSELTRFAVKHGYTQI